MTRDGPPKYFTSENVDMGVRYTSLSIYLIHPFYICKKFLLHFNTIIEITTSNMIAIVSLVLYQILLLSEEKRSPFLYLEHKCLRTLSFVFRQLSLQWNSTVELWLAQTRGQVLGIFFLSSDYIHLIYALISIFNKKRY